MDSHPDGFDVMNLDQTRFPGRDTFEVFQEAAAEFPVRCSFEYRGDDPFFTNWVATQSAGAAAIRWTCAAHTTRRTERDIAESAPGGYAVLYALSGGARITQDGREFILNPGSAAIYDLDQPLEVNMLEAQSRDYMLFSIPRSVALAAAPSEPYENPLKLLTGRTPLFQCIDYMSHVLARRSVDEREHVFNACAALFTAELLSVQRDDTTHARSKSASRDLFDQILYCIDLEIGNPELTPQWLAQRFGVSPRYIHKLFGAQGLTCQTYITHARLKYARHDLVNSPMKIQIATLAYRWGFSDPSSFGRAFRNLFGHSPGIYKSRKRDR